MEPLLEVVMSLLEHIVRNHAGLRLDEPHGRNGILRLALDFVFVRAEEFDPICAAHKFVVVWGILGAGDDDFRARCHHHFLVAEVHRDG